ncbi:MULTISPECIES: gamma-glutamylcyclotransferase [unclassified Anabaena]|uniref:gamma-glutamylcyclotransferase family protein n=1 Tax=unclassified Anabaena TaxID=2619674 RepID=UPI0039C65514
MIKSNTKFPGLVRVFVYGTLKPGEANYQKYCAGLVTDVKRAVTLGKLFALPMGYPAMTPGGYSVHGYLLCFADLGILDALDDLEDYQPARQMSENLYYRQQVEICDLQELSLGEAWAYFMSPKRVSQLQGVALLDGWWSNGD